ncbi:GNAT family N-acetyltransferase [Clostridium sp. D2Q-11]|uniref:GNAT family N-acetyltransferase n=1 Tax=Anaeromonas frigoriresistens TaxID=2683708 RepID=A0A942UU70_9FIRM|nr:GNAT family N-acetyltransferase [Anaeromonas frigoriresistens]MBS4537535.1 GNAT family N-acetyltransferase [Anaeromonas frigoriresistens]
MKLRRIDIKKDKDIIISFREDTYRISFGTEEGFNEASYIERMKERVNKFPNGQLIVEKENKAIGQLGLLTRNNLEDYIGYINLIYLIPEYRYKGIGESLLKYAEGFFKQLELTEYHLRVSATNKKAINFYTKFGMKKIEEENEKQPIFLMRKVL